MSKIHARILIVLSATLLSQGVTFAASMGDVQKPCVRLVRDLVIGSVDSDTAGEVSVLQSFLVKDVLLVDGIYDGNMADAVIEYQKSVGMNFVTRESGVGMMTRKKLQEGCAAWKKYTNGNFSFKYPPSRGLFITKSPANWVSASESDGMYPSVTIAPESARKNIGKAACYFDNLSGLPQKPHVCTAQNDADSVTFFVVPRSVSAIRKSLNHEPLTTRVIAGKNAFAVQAGFEGSGFAMYLIPLQLTKTLVARYNFEWTHHEDSLTEYQEIIDTLVVR
jgi:hypothetical protein